MNRSTLVRGVVIPAFALIGFFAATSARADDMVANPKYSAWAKFKVGSNSTMDADMEVGGNKFHIQTVRTLISLDADKVVIESKTTVNIMGHDQAEPATRETIASKIGKDQIIATGEKEISAMGKTFKCKVYQAKGNPDMKQDHMGANTEAMKATVYTNDDVPGGLVEIDTTGNDGKGLTFVLTAMEAK